MGRPTEPTAFPSVHGHQLYPGLTKRELFALITMQGLIASPLKRTNDTEAIAKDAILLGDELLSQLNKPA
jgi:hypothetical protein